MRFELTPEIVDQIIFSMENQDTGFVFDSLTSTVVQNIILSEEDPDRYLSIPEWTSADGFHLMEKFVASLRNPLAREKLRSVLGSGKGVFRNFKNAVKDQEGIERLWFAFKEKEMRLRVTEWYNQLADLWGWARVKPEADVEETAELIISDFEVRGDCGSSRELIETLDHEAFAELYQGFPPAFVESRYNAERAHLSPGDEGSFVLCTMTPAGELAGFIWASRTTFAARHGEDPTLGAKIFQVLQLCVRPEYRGLGVAKLLVERMCEAAYEQGAAHVLFALPGSGEVLKDYLEEIGFEEYTRSLVLDLDRWGRERGETV